MSKAKRLKTLLCDMLLSFPQKGTKFLAIKPLPFYCYRSAWRSAGQPEAAGLQCTAQIMQFYTTTAGLGTVWNYTLSILAATGKTQQSHPSNLLSCHKISYGVLYTQSELLLQVWSVFPRDVEHFWNSSFLTFIWSSDLKYICTAPNKIQLKFFRLLLWEYSNEIQKSTVKESED